MSRRTKNRAARGVCPTCGCSWKPYATPRKGGRRYIKPAKQSFGRHGARTHNTRASRVRPNSRPIRTYGLTEQLYGRKSWPHRGPSRDVVTCPDPWHEEQNQARMDRLRPPEPETGVLLTKDKKADLAERRQQKVRKHRDRQAKDRR